MSAPDEFLERIAAVLASAGVSAGTRICCALSGGVDSVVLFEALRRLQPRVGYGLSAAHVHHGLSPNADAWAAACTARGARAGVPVQVFRVEIERNHPDGIEAAARAARHAALDTVACDWLAFGHHQDDQAETLLFRLLRGGGVRGAAAMRVLSPPVRGRPGRLRPLLALRRAEIEDWARRQGLDWVEDESNAALHHTRNALRHRLLPVAETLFPAAVPTLARAAAHFAEADDLLGELAALDARACGGLPLSRQAFLALGGGRQANLLRWLLQRAGAQAPSSRRLAEALRQLGALPAARALDVSLGAWALRAYRDRVWLEPSAEPVVEALVWDDEPALPWAGGYVRFEAACGEGLSAARLAAAKRRALAPRTSGMSLRLSPQRPRRELRKLCQEAGIPAWLRARLPVLWVDGEPAWVGGIGIEAAFAAAPGEPGVLPRWSVGEPGAGGEEPAAWPAA